MSTVSGACCPRHPGGWRRKPSGPGRKSIDNRRYAPATQRNREAILAVLRAHLPGGGVVLELASGSGEHVVHFAANLPELLFQPSDPDATARASIDDWAAASGLANLRPALALDATAASWPIAGRPTRSCASTMIHIAPWSAACGLMAARPARCRGRRAVSLRPVQARRRAHRAEQRCVRWTALRAQNPAWGVRDLRRSPRKPRRPVSRRP